MLNALFVVCDCFSGGVRLCFRVCLCGLVFALVYLFDCYVNSVGVVLVYCIVYLFFIGLFGFV